MKRTPVVLLASGALVAAIAGTALASGGGDDASPSRSASSSATASSAPSTGKPTASPTGSASASASESVSGSPTAVPSSDDTAWPTGTAAPGAAVDSRRAGRIALAHVGGGTVTKVESETEHGRAVWSVRIVKDGARYDVDVDRATGEVTRSRAKAGEDSRSGDDHRGGDRGGDDGDSGRHGRHHD
ncbi:PepSY domain-containing protein [Streptomyces apricus]|uniref:PepSY domain-containing protein n=1 Tax=Streptomyces apricus TaxID=1828112 RepID=A0A5B0BJE9_9ACTN|nr:PepSY domain-containing protein [Streptomyces apricus]KAA0941099.1 hypothetical protein FGF04_07110 [Streptomyces apricus]